LQVTSASVTVAPDRGSDDDIPNPVAVRQAALSSDVRTLKWQEKLFSVQEEAKYRKSTDGEKHGIEDQWGREERYRKMLEGECQLSSLYGGGASCEHACFFLPHVGEHGDVSCPRLPGVQMDFLVAMLVLLWHYFMAYWLTCTHLRGKPPVWHLFHGLLSDVHTHATNLQVQKMALQDEFSLTWTKTASMTQASRTG
jgi:hypothetical protein